MNDVNLPKIEYPRVGFLTKSFTRHPEIPEEYDFWTNILSAERFLYEQVPGVLFFTPAYDIEGRPLSERAVAVYILRGTDDTITVCHRIKEQIQDDILAHVGNTSWTPGFLPEWCKTLQENGGIRSLPREEVAQFFAINHDTERRVPFDNKEFKVERAKRFIRHLYVGPKEGEDKRPSAVYRMWVIMAAYDPTAVLALMDTQAAPREFFFPVYLALMRLSRQRYRQKQFAESRRRHRQRHYPNYPFLTEKGGRIGESGRGLR